MYGFGRCSCGRPMLRPIVRPPASLAPRFAASMMPPPPPVQTTDGGEPRSIDSADSVTRRASPSAYRTAVALSEDPGVVGWGALLDYPRRGPASPCLIRETRRERAAFFRVLAWTCGGSRCHV